MAEDDAVSEGSHFFGGHSMFEVFVGVWMKFEERAVSEFLLPHHNIIFEELKCASLAHRDGEDGCVRHDIFCARARDSILFVAVRWGKVFFSMVGDDQSVIWLLTEFGAETMKLWRRWLAVVVGAFLLPPAVDDPHAEVKFYFWGTLQVVATDGELGERQCIAPSKYLSVLHGR